MNRRLIVLVVGTVATLMVVGCAKAPDQEIAAAKAAVAAVQAVEADKYLPEEARALQDSLAAALAVVEKQNGAFAMTRDYNGATQSLQALTVRAAAAQQNAVAAKEKAKVDCDSAVVKAQAALTGVRDLLLKAPKGKEGKEAFWQCLKS